MLNILKAADDDKGSVGLSSQTGDFKKNLRWHIGEPKHAEFWVISPAHAEELLSLNTDEDYKNRPAGEHTIARYARAIKEGRWALTGEPIILSSDGVLLNGQHRLYACVRSGCDFETLVVFGIDRETFKFMDRGMKRTASHVFSIEGVPNATLMAAAMMWVYRITNLNGFAVAPSNALENEQLLDLYYENDGLQRSAWVANAIKREGESLISPSLMTALHFLFAQKNRAMADDFMSKVVTGIGIEAASDPEHQIRKWLSNDNKNSAGRSNDTYRAVYVTLAWNARRMNKQIKVFRWRTEQSPNAPFPAIR